MGCSNIWHVAAVSSAIIICIILHHVLKNEVTLPSRRLVLGVLSARDHFSHRQAIRQTWGSLVQNLSGVEVKFVLGDQDCPVHPADRVSPDTCHKWNLSQDINSSMRRAFFKSHQSWYESNLNSVMNLECYIGVGFRVMSPVVIKAFIVRTDVAERSNRTILELSDPEEVIERMQVSDSLCSSGRDYCSLKLPHPLLLPQGFEGELRVFNAEDNEHFCGKEFFSLQRKRIWICDWTNHSVLEYKFLRTRKDMLTRWQEASCPLVSAEFSIAKQQALVWHREGQAQRDEEWRLHLADIQLKVEAEKNQHSDLLIFPHLDVYAKLPHKVMAFLHWATHDTNSSYVMKVDDDTFVNLAMLNQLIKDAADETHVWWSLFHHHRAVPVYGKWADFTYPSLTYPMFPSGAGYLMTKSLASAVAGASDHLATHGGEDVSMGIWVSSVSSGTRQVEVPCWLPHPQCLQSFLIPQLSFEQVKEVWQKQIALDVQDIIL